MRELGRAIARRDRTIAAVFGGLSLLFLTAASTSPAFFEWVFARHENLLSWFVRPLFLIPFCLFAYHRSLAGVSITVFALLTSMFWFPQPAETPSLVREFLAFEKEYLSEGWSLAKLAMTALVPLTMGLLASAFWKRNLWLGFSTMALIAALKAGWSLLFGGESGTAVIAPAVVGLLACLAFVYLGLRSKRLLSPGLSRRGAQ